MIVENGEFIKCDKCDAKIKNHRWGRTKAEGWFFSRDVLSPAYCPQHVPDWVADWRAKFG